MKINVTRQQALLLREAIDRHVTQLNDCISRAVGDLYPRIWASNVKDLRAVGVQLDAIIVRPHIKKGAKK